jgi:hypothetical protein
MITYDQQEKIDKQPKWIWNLKATYEFIQNNKQNKTKSFMSYERIKPSFKLPIATQVVYNTRSIT